MKPSIARPTSMERCPYLGLHDDSSTALGYPSAWNYCYRASPPASIVVSHQAETCLCPQFAQCTVYATNKWGRLPASLRGRPVARAGLHGGLRRTPLFLLLLALLASAFLLQFPERVASFRSRIDALLASGISAMELVANPDPADAPVTPVAEGKVLPATAGTAGPAAALPGTLEALAGGTAYSPAVSPTLALTPPGTCGHALDAPIGEHPRFLVHRVLSGENLTLYAEQYQTTTDAILAVNYHLPMPVWEDWIIVLPVGRTDVDGIPPFEPYQALGAGISLSELAAQLNTDPQLLYKYNAFKGVCQLFSGWLIIPRKPADS